MPLFVDRTDDAAWLNLETAVALWQRCNGDRNISYGREVYGGCLEPGYRLQSETEMVECPDCSRFRCKRRDWEQVDGGSLNYYYSLSCDACGLYEPENWNV